MIDLQLKCPKFQTQAKLLSFFTSQIELNHQNN